MSRYIDADALMEQLWDAETRIGYVQVVDAQTIMDAPTVDVVPVKVADYERPLVQPYFRKHWQEFCCSNCKKRAYTWYKYCPECGAKFRSDVR